MIKAIEDYFEHMIKYDDLGRHWLLIASTHCTTRFCAVTECKCHDIRERLEREFKVPHIIGVHQRTNSYIAYPYCRGTLVTDDRMCEPCRRLVTIAMAQAPHLIPFSFALIGAYAYYWEHVDPDEHLKDFKWRCALKDTETIELGVEDRKKAVIEALLRTITPTLDKSTDGHLCYYQGAPIIYRKLYHYIHHKAIDIVENMWDRVVEDVFKSLEEEE